MWFIGKYDEELGLLISPTNGAWGQILGHSRGFVYKIVTFEARHRHAAMAKPPGLN
jgi:hypothetical protein